MATIPNCSHLYATLKLVAKSGTTWSGEMAQYGIRIRVGTGQKDTSDGLIDLDTFSVQDAAVTRDNTDFDIDQAWSGVSSGGNTITDGDMDAIAQAMRGSFYDSRIYSSPLYTLDVIKIYAVHQAQDGKWYAGSPNAYYPKVATPGSAAKTMPPDVACAVSFFTATRGVKGRGRVYVGPIAQTSLDNDGRLSNAAVTSLGTSFQTALNSIRAIGGPTTYRYTPIVWHRVGDKAGLETGRRGSVIARVEVNDVLDTQRRRDKQAFTSWADFPLT